MQNDTLDRQTSSWFDRVTGGRHDQSLMTEVSIDAQALECRTLFSATPLLLDAVEVDVAEDAPDTDLDLSQYFSLDDGAQPVNYSLIDQNGDDLLDAVTLRPDGQLSLSYGENKFGQAALTIQATNLTGQVESLPVQVDVRPLNDSPTTTGLLDVSVAPDTARTVIDLFSAFEDIEDGSRGLTYSVARNSNPGLFDSITIDQQRGRLILDYADGRSGSSEVTILATDSGGLSVGLSSEDFTVYDQIFGRGGTQPDTTDLGFERAELWTGGRYHDRVNGQYQFDYVNFDKLDRYLATADASQYHVFNIENSSYDNSPAGRDRFAELFSYVKAQRPDLQIGVYRIMPEAQWYDPVKLHTSQVHESLGISSGYTRNEAQFEANYHDWQLRNSLYRTEEVSDEFGGGTVADLVDGINPHLYTFRRGDSDRDDPIWRLASLDPNADTITIDGPSFDDVETMRLQIATDASLDNGLQTLTTYYVVNSSGTTSQISLTPGGPPIDFDSDFSGRIYAGATDYSNLWHDPNVLNWQVYAEENIAEARKFGKPVYAYVSPSLKVLAAQPMEYEFFRWQLEVLRPLVDGVVIYESPGFDGAHQVQQEWWRALEDFAGTLNGPSASFTVNVAASSNDVPVANDDSLAAVEDAPAVWRANALLSNDVDSDPLAITRFSQPDHGTISRLSNGSLRYVPQEDFHGTDQFRYHAGDGQLESTAATVQIAVAPRNDAPVAENDQYSVLEDSTRTIDVESLLGNDADADGDALSLQIVVAPSHGTIELTEDDEIVYTPDANFNGTDTFRYRVNDGQALSNAALVVVNVLPVNDRPAAATDILRTKEDTPIVIDPTDLTRNDRDADNDSMRVVAVEQPSHGTLKRGPEGQLIYRPHRNYYGQDQFEYSVTDGTGRSDAVAVQLRVAPDNDSPVTVNDRYSLRDDRVLRVEQERGVLANDRDLEGNSLRARLLRAPSHGRVRLNLDGSFTYHASSGYAGLDQFSYVVYDGQGGRSVGDVRVHVAPTEEPRTFSRSAETVQEVQERAGDATIQIRRLNERSEGGLRRGGRAWLRALRDR